MSPNVEKALELNRQAAEYLEKFSRELMALGLNEAEQEELEKELIKLNGDWCSAAEETEFT